jgi:hypothetical protein
MFKKPDGDTAEPRLWATLRDEMSERLVSRSEGRGCGRAIAAVSKGAVRRDVVAVRREQTEDNRGQP